MEVVLAFGNLVRLPSSSMCGFIQRLAAGAFLQDNHSTGEQLLLDSRCCASELTINYNGSGMMN